MLKRRSQLFTFLIAILSVSSLAMAAGKSSKQETLIGTWYSDRGTAVFRQDGTMTFNGESAYYQVGQGQITFLGAGGALVLTYQLSPGKLVTKTQDGTMTIFTRTAPKAAQRGKSGGAAPDIAGKWCYMSNIYASDGGRMSNRCITLNPNGTYEYYAETSSSGQYGSSASQESDRGTWTATASSITSHSNRSGTRTFRLEKRNHPKTHDPLLVIDGDAYVTFYQRRPW